MPEAVNKMQVNKIEDPEGNILKIEFIQGDGTTFKDEIKTWVAKNYPTMTFQTFFERMIEFWSGRCTIDMQ